MDASRYIHNACLIPPIRPDSEVTVDANGTPDWASTLILCEVRIATATKEGTLEAAVAVLEHYAEMGVNGLWLCPVYDPGDSGNGYSNIGPHSIDPAITGTDDYTEGWRVLRRFVDEAHKRNIRILLDVISWGTVNESPLYAAHPDWYTGNSVWGGREFNFANEAFTAWYIDEVVGIALKTGCDGFRYDVEPSYAGYAVDGEIRRRLLQQGKKIFTIGEADNERGGAYDVEQGGVTGTVTEENYQAPEPIYFMLDRYDLVDSIRSGEHLGSVAAQEKGMGGRYRYYTNCLSCHDNRYPVAHGNRLAFGYAIHSNPNQHEQSTLKAWTDAGFMAATDLKKGVRFNFNTTEANVREGYKKTMNLKGMQLHFRGFRGTGFGITIADTGSSYPPQFGAGTRSLAIRYDAAQKRIFAVTLDDAGVATETDLIQNITLSERAYFTYTFAINAQYGYDFTVSVDDATYTGVISKEVMDQAKAITNVGKIEVSVNSGGFSRTQIDYIGVRQLTLVDVTAVADVIRMIDSIGTVSLENGTPIRAARKAYEQLNKEEKEAVTNYGVLRKAEEDYRDLAVKADRALTYITVADSRHTGSTAEAIQKTVRVDWVNNMRASNVETGGLHLEFIGAVSGHREGYSKKVDMTDLLLQFDDLEAVYAENSRFAVLLGKDSGFYGIQYDPANPPLALVLDPAAGTLTAYPSGHVLIQSEYLKLEKLRGKRFSYELSANGENAGFTLTVRTAGQELQGTLLAEDIAAAKLLTNPAGCSIMLCPWATETTATCTFSLDLIGVCQTAMLKKVERVKALIAALPSVITRDDIDMVNEVLASYRALSRTLRSLVDNQNVLEKALAQVYELLKEDTSWGGEASSDASGEQGNAASPKTGETLPYIWLLLPILGLAAAAGSWLLKRKSSEAGDSLREGGTKSC